MTLNDLERRNSPYFAFFSTKFDCFAGQLGSGVTRVGVTVSPGAATDECHPIFLEKSDDLFSRFL